MIKKIVFILTLAVASFAACNHCEEDAQPIQEFKKGGLVVRISTPVTRLAYADNGNGGFAATFKEDGSDRLWGYFRNSRNAILKYTTIDGAQLDRMNLPLDLASLSDDRKSATFVSDCAAYPEGAASLFFYLDNTSSYVGYAEQPTFVDFSLQSGKVEDAHLRHVIVGSSKIADMDSDQNGNLVADITFGYKTTVLKFELTFPEDVTPTADENTTITLSDPAVYNKVRISWGEPGSNSTKGNIVFHPSSVDGHVATAYVTVWENTQFTDAVIRAVVGENQCYVTLNTSKPVEAGKVYRIARNLTKFQKTDGFDPNNVVASFAAISDVHIGNSYGSDEKFTSALDQLKARAAVDDADGLDAVLVVGDLIQNAANENQINTFKSLYESKLDPVKVPMIYTVGNHDITWNSSMATNADVFHTLLGDNYFLTDLDQQMRLDYECRHCSVGGYHILALTPESMSPTEYNIAAVTWLDEKLSALTAADPDKYVIVMTHPMIKDTVYGSTLGASWYTMGLTEVLNKYPQVITLGGHLHFPLNDPRSISQDRFTSLGCASTSYMAFEGGEYENKISSTKLSDAGEYSEGLLLQFDASGNMRATRLDFYRTAEIGSAWTTDYPKTDGSHLDRYNHGSLEAVNSAPSLSVANVEISNLADGKGDVSVTFAAGSDDEFVHHYSVSILSGTTPVVTKNYMSDFYRCPQTSQMAQTWTADMGSLPEGSYILNIVAYDSWDAASEPLRQNFMVGIGVEEKWVTDAAGSVAFEGGSGNAAGEWLSYADGQVSWTANASGKPRKEMLTLPNGLKYIVTQIEASDFRGDWNFRAKRFKGCNKLGIGDANESMITVTLDSPLSTTALQDEVTGRTITNNVGISGLFSTAVMDAVLDIDYEAKKVRMGLFCDARSAQEADTGDAIYPYVFFAPELGGSFIGRVYNFSPYPLGTSQNYGWIWLDANETLDTFIYNSDNRSNWNVTGDISSKMVIGISVLTSKSSTPAANLMRGANSNGVYYELIYQANASNEVMNGMSFIRQ